MSPHPSPITKALTTRRAEVIDWIRDNIPAVQIAARLGFDVPATTMHYHFKSNGLTRPDLGFDNYAPAPANLAADIATLPAPLPRLADEFTKDYLARNADLVHQCHALNLTGIEMAHVFGLDADVLRGALCKVGLSRKALGLPNVHRQSMKFDSPAIKAFTAFEDLHIRRGQFSGTAPSVIGAVCRRNASEVLSRARELGLGDWQVFTDAKLRQALSRSFDEGEDISILLDTSSAPDGGRLRSDYPKTRKPYARKAMQV